MNKIVDELKKIKYFTLQLQKEISRESDLFPLLPSLMERLIFVAEIKKKYTNSCL